MANQNLIKGQLFRFRFRAKNINGWSLYSPIAYIRAGTVPARPKAPLYVSVNKDSIQILIQPVQDDGGSEITTYELWRNQGTGTLDFIQVTSYDGTSLQKQMTPASDGLVVGQIYKFQIRAVNEFGPGEFSETLAIGLTDYPAAPQSLQKQVGNSGSNFITLSWLPSADTDLPVIGYLLYMYDNSLGTNKFQLVYNGTNYPNIQINTVGYNYVKKAGQYSFYVNAVNFNGAGPSSSTQTYSICVPPSNISYPLKTAVTKTTMTLQWSAPQSDGGCPILSYQVWMDDGNGGSFSVIGASDIDNKPTLRNYQISSFQSTDTAKTFNFKIRAINSEGYTESIPIPYVLAAVPDLPTNIPTINYFGTQIDRIRVDYSAFSLAQNGGAPILSYELQIYNFTLSQWISLVGGYQNFSIIDIGYQVGARNQFTLKTSFTAMQGIQRGITYQFKYRAWNINGPSPFSQTAILLAAQPPARPDPPKYKYGYSTSSQIVLLLSPPSDDGGAIIQRMDIYMSQQFEDSWTKLTNYDGSSVSYTVSVATDSIIAYQKYRFRLTATNAQGTSSPSPEVILSVAPVPSKFSAVTKLQDLSSSTSIMVTWTNPTDTEPILGYQLQLYDTVTELSSIIYNEPDNQNLQKFMATKLIPGNLYGFSVLGINFNGQGQTWSDLAYFRSCTVPINVSLPIVVSQTSTNLGFQWQDPQYDGGCPVETYTLLVEDKTTGLLQQVYQGLSHINATTVSIDPTISNLGQSFKYMLTATNNIGTSTSVVGYVLFASVPQAPSAGPISDPSFTNQFQIKITWPTLTSNGGSEILGYQLEIDDGEGGDFQILTRNGTQIWQNYLQLFYTVSQNITKGTTYRFRLKAKNAVGWGTYSPISFIKAASVPNQPPAPQFSSASSLGFVLNLKQTNGDGGDTLTSYRIYRDQGTGQAPIWTQLTNYDGQSMSYSATIANDNLVLGSTYRIIFVAVNTYGESEYSLPLVVGAGQPPSISSAVIRDPNYDYFDVFQNKVQILIRWDQTSLVHDLNVLGYQLLMDDGLGTNSLLIPIFDSQNNPQVASFLVKNLTAGLNYKFQVKARDVNGLGSGSPFATFTACLVPVPVDIPLITSISKNTFGIRWNVKENTGGCPITSYSILMSSDFSISNPIYNSIVSSLPPGTQSQLVSITNLALTGKALRVKIRITNQMGSVDSIAVQFVLASVPPKPTPSPNWIPSLTSISSIGVNFANTNSDTGGSSIIEYELQMDDGQSGDFSTVFQSFQATQFVATSQQFGITRGKFYRFRYRVQNINGFSDWSDVSYIQASQTPIAPQQPTFISATDTSITVQLFQSLDSRGVDVTEYLLFIDSGNDLSSAYRQVTNYDGLAITYTFQTNLDNLGAPGTIYKIKTLAENTDGVNSDYSESLVVALASVPSSPNIPVKIDTGSGPSQIMITWNFLTGQTLPVYGYRLYSDFGTDFQFYKIFDGKNEPTQNSFLFLNATDPNQIYKFYVTAINFNGEGTRSPVASLQSCTYPSSGRPGFIAPIITSISSTQIGINWTEPVSNGGCQILGYAIYIADVSTSIFAEYESVNVRNKPFLNNYIIDMASIGKIPGQTYIIRLGVYNRISESLSDTVRVLLASIPLAPSPPVKQILNNTLGQIKYFAPASDGGDIIDSYQLQIRYDNNEWISVLGEMKQNQSRNLSLQYTFPINQLGQIIQARVRCKNQIGWSPFSNPSYLLLAVPPQKPPAPTYLSSTSTSISIAINPSPSTQGSDIVSYEVWYTTLGNTPVQDTSYAQATTHTLTNLVAGQMYSIKVRSQNGEGYSEFSEYLEKAASKLPDVSTTILSKNLILSSPNSIYLYWTKVTDQQIQNSGYLLWMAYDYQGSSLFQLILNATQNPEINSFLVQNLKPGRIYRFKLQALNFNGASDFSQEFSFNACVAPSSLLPPTRTDSTVSSISIQWQAPLSDGGCPILGYAVYRDNANSGIPSVEVNTINDPSVRNIPTLSTLTVTSFSAGSEGQFVRFSLRAFNRESQVDSSGYVSILYAALPSQPSQILVLDTTISNSTIIYISLPALLSTETGNTPIQAYSLEIDDGFFGLFVVIDKDSMVLNRNASVQPGLEYRLRYRALNSVGFSPYSNILTVLAAQPPAAPPMPQFVQSTGSSLTLQFFETENDGGARVSSYQLFMSSNYQTSSPTFTQVTGYSNSLMSYTLTSATDGIDVGTLYAFKFRALNIKGYSEFSRELLIAAASPISTPAAPIRRMDLSTKSSLYISWQQSLSTGINVLGYYLEMSEGTADNYKIIYNGSLNDEQTYYNVTQLNTGTLYKFRVTALNWNGPSNPGSPLVVHACLNPVGASQPRKVISTATQIIIEWDAPPDDGGCSILGYQLYRDSGGGLSDTISIEIDSGVVRNQPSLRQYTINLSSSETGKQLRFQIMTLHAEGSSLSPIGRFLIAGKPLKPTGPITVQYAETPYVSVI